MYGRSTQKIKKRQEFIKVHVYNNKDNNNLEKDYFAIIDFFEVIVSIIFSIICSLWMYFLLNLSEINYSLKFSSTFTFFFCLGFLSLIFAEESTYPTFELASSLAIIDPTSLLHEIIHGKIFEKVQGSKRWEVWVINREFWCFGYIPESVRFPNFILKSMIARLIHLIHDLICSFIFSDIYTFFEYIKDFFKEEKDWLKELKTQIKVRKS